MHQAREKEQFLDFLRRRGLRVTRERLLLFEEIFTRHGHIDAEDLLAGLRQRDAKISRATVYRNLDLLVECGVVTKHRLGRDRFFYEHLHQGQRHDHLVCAGCGRVVEFVSPGIVALQGEICRAHGFVPTVHTLQIASLCQACAREAAPRETAVDTVAPGAAPAAVAAAMGR